MTYGGETEVVVVPKLTADELMGLQSLYNLGDAHTHQDPSAEEAEAIINRLPQIFWEAARGPQHLLDQQGAEAFLRLSGQQSAIPLGWYLPVYSSSVAMEIIANAMRMLGRSAVLTEPTFDNIADILRRQLIPLTPLRLEPGDSYRDAATRAADAGTSDVLILVLPNNPTGHRLTAAELFDVAAACAARSITLVLDVSFRVHDARMLYDQYEVLTSAAADYIVIEDTGKIWPTTDLKLAYILASESWRPLLEEIQQDVLLNVSKFVSCLVRYFSELSELDGLRSVREVLDVNRLVLRKAIDDGLLPLDVVNGDSAVGVEFMRLTSGERANAAVERLRSRGLTVLSGEAFYWSNPSDGADLVRIALARDPVYFDAAIRALVRLFELPAA